MTIVDIFIKQAAINVIFTLFILSSCQEKKNETITKKKPEEKALTDSVFKELFGESTENERLVEFDEKKIDTILKLKNNLKLSLTFCDSTLILDYIYDNITLKSITSKFENSHESALAVEKHLFKTNKNYFKRDSFGLSLKLENGLWKTVSLNDSTFDEYDNTFEHYFKDFGFYSVRTQLGEGNCFKLIEKKSGKETRINGRPYFSQNGKYVIVLNCDIEAGFSSNGFQLFKNMNGKLKELIEYDPKNWGSISAKWINDSTIILKNESIQKQFYTKLTIKNSD